MHTILLSNGFYSFSDLKDQFLMICNWFASRKQPLNLQTYFRYSELVNKALYIAYKKVKLLAEVSQMNNNHNIQNFKKPFKCFNY